MKNSVTRDFIAYDYLSLNVPIEHEQLYIDCYQNFGWVLISNVTRIDKNDYYINNYNYNEIEFVNIKFKRDRKIKNKLKLYNLQTEMEKALKKIIKLEKQPELLAIMYSLIIGIIGTIFLTLFILSIISKNNLYILNTINIIIGIICLILPYFVYNKVKIKTKEKNQLLIEEQYNIVYDNCEKANDLLD